MQVAEPVRTTSAAPAALAPQRNIALDAYRGFVMVLMMAEVLHLSQVSRAYPENGFWRILAWNQTHVEWAGCSLHDLIQPSFSFLVGAALPYSIAARLAKGASFGRMFAHALWRSLLLVALGVFLRSTHRPMTYFTFEDTLSQIGLGYPVLFLLGFKPRRWQWTALGILLFGYWLAWALYPVPGPGFDWQSVGVSATWQHFYTGFAAHWNKNANLGNAFDQWFLNLFPRTSPFVFNGGGYLTLSFIPTLGTMILGLIAGEWVRQGERSRLLFAGVAGIAAGLVLHFAGICPVVKRIWTPSWTLASGGACFLLLALFLWLGNRRWLFPFVVVGVNSIAAYLIAHLFEEFILSSFKIHLGAGAFQLFGPGLEPLFRGFAVLLVYWLILYWMYRRKLFLRL